MIAQSAVGISIVSTSYTVNAEYVTMNKAANLFGLLINQPKTDMFLLLKNTLVAKRAIPTKVRISKIVENDAIYNFKGAIESQRNTILQLITNAIPNSPTLKFLCHVGFCRSEIPTNKIDSRTIFSKCAKVLSSINGIIYIVSFLELILDFRERFSSMKNEAKSKRYGATMIGSHVEKIMSHDTTDDMKITRTSELIPCRTIAAIQPKPEKTVNKTVDNKVLLES